MYRVNIIVQKKITTAFWRRLDQFKLSKVDYIRLRKQRIYLRKGRENENCFEICPYYFCFFFCSVFFHRNVPCIFFLFYFSDRNSSIEYVRKDLAIFQSTSNFPFRHRSAPCSLTRSHSAMTLWHTLPESSTCTTRQSADWRRSHGRSRSRRKDVVRQDHQEINPALKYVPTLCQVSESSRDKVAILGSTLSYSMRFSSNIAFLWESVFLWLRGLTSNISQADIVENRMTQHRAK